LQYYRAMPQLSSDGMNLDTKNKLRNEPLAETGPVKNTTEIKVPNIRVKVPTLILWGEQDQAFVNENLDGIEQYVPDCIIHRFLKTSHWLQHEKPIEVNNAIAKFITA
jgi:pimeloyl-ACP methyl ester carboxylesterase